MFGDVVVEDRNDRPFMVVEVKAPVASSEVLREFVDQLDHSGASILFGMLVDLEDIHLLKRDSPQGAFTVLVHLKTREMLRRYAPEFAGKDARYVRSPIFHDYFETLVEGWLRDLAYHWKSANPPGAEVLAGTGLLERIKEGMTRRTEGATGGHSLS